MKHFINNSLPGIVKTLFCVFLLVNPGNNYAQEESAQPKKKKARVSLEYYNFNNETYKLKAVVKTKVDRSYEQVPGVELTFYSDSIHPDTKLGMATTDHTGSAICVIPDKEIDKSFNMLQRTWIAAIENNPKYRDADRDTDIKPAWLFCEYVEGDSMNTINVKVTTLDSSLAKVPAGNVPVRIFVDRMFGQLPVNDEFETTGDDGTYKFVFPEDIPGNSNGSIDIIVKVIDHPMFGYLQSSEKKNWGIIIKDKNLLDERALWSARANAPIYLVIIANMIILGIWGVLAYIIYQLVKIKNLGLIKASAESP